MTALRPALLLATALLAACGTPPAQPETVGPTRRIDVHGHIFKTGPEYGALLERLDLHVLNVCVVGKDHIGPALAVVKQHPDRMAFCSSFDRDGWEEPGFAEKAIAQLEETFKNGAVGVKIWKDIGLLRKTKDGQYVLPDHPAFEPIYSYIASQNKTLLAHLAEPAESWKPLDPSTPHHGYYKNNPFWHNFKHPDRPTREQILAARDRVMKRHPKLRVVGAHIGSAAHDVDEVARALDRHPNFAVETAARVQDLMVQPSDKVRAFMIKYQDRVLYGTDLNIRPKDRVAAKLKRMEERYARDWKYFATSETLTFKGRTVQGLALPPAVLRKFYTENAKRWFPGIAP